MLTVPGRVVARVYARHDEAGFTLVEMMIASAAVVLLFTMMTSTIYVFGKAETSTVNSANSAASTRLALLLLQHDIQSADPIVLLGLPASAATQYDDELPLTIQPSNVVVTWRYDPTTQDLTRTVGSGAAVVELTNVVNGSTTPVFSYYDHCAINLVTESGSTSGSVQADTTVVQVTLSLANTNSAPYGTSTKVNIMNLAPGPSRCG